MPVMKTISREQVRAARGAIGWSIRDLAEKSGVAVNTISRFENGSADALLETLLKIQDTFEQAGIDFPDEFSVSFRRVKETDRSGE
jgi:transcriptional regulator with XRE-family HTH domain